MNQAQKFKAQGIWTAIVTPMQAGGEVDYPALERLIEFQTANGVDGIVPCGTTGESPTLTWQEHDQVIEFSAQKANGRVGVLAGTGSNNTAEAIRGTRHAKKAGADAALIVDCYYNGPSSLELRTEYYEKILNKVPEIPLVPYIIPARTGCALGVADIALLHSHFPERLYAVKEASGDFGRMKETRKLAGKNLAIMSGDDDLILAMMQESEIASPGAVSVMSNIAPKAFADMIRLQRAADSDAAGEMAADLQPILNLVGCTIQSRRRLPNGHTLEVTDKYRNPSPVKTMMMGLGMVGAGIRAPLGKMSADAVQRCRDALREVQRRNKKILAPIENAFGVKIEKRLADDAIWNELSR